MWGQNTGHCLLWLHRDFRVGGVAKWEITYVSKSIAVCIFHSLLMISSYPMYSAFYRISLGFNNSLKCCLLNIPLCPHHLTFLWFLPSHIWKIFQIISSWSLYLPTIREKIICVRYIGPYFIAIIKYMRWVLHWTKKII